MAAFVEGAVNRLYTGADKAALRADAIHARLADIAADPGRARHLIVLVANRESLAELAKAEARRPVLRELRLEPVSPRSAGLPLYLFTRAQTADDIRKNPKQRRRVAFGVSDRTRNVFDAAGAQAILEPVLGVAPEVRGTTSDPGDLLNQLLDSNANSPRAVDVVAIYDDEPSILVHDFLEIYRPRAALGAEALRVQLFLLPTKDPNFAPELRLGSTGATYSIAQDEKLRFNDLGPFLPRDGTDGFIALSPQYKGQGPGADIPVILSNVRRVLTGPAAARAGAELQRAVSLSYLAGLLTVDSGDRCQRVPDQTFQTYLLQALFADTQSLSKSLALWSNVRIAATRPASSADHPESELIERMVNDRLAQLATTTRKLDYRKVVGALAPGRSSLGVRQQFSGDYSTLFRTAADQVRKVVESTPNDVQALKSAQQALLELLLDGKGPACELPGPGLFGEKAYDPFLYLSVIDSLISLQSSSGGKD